MTEIIDEIVMAPAMETEDDSPIEPMATDDTQTAAHRTDFTSELYKIELNNVGKFGYGEMKKLLRNKLGLKPVKIKTPNLSGKHRGHCYLCFRSGDERQEAMDKLDGYKWKGQVIKAKLAQAVVDPLLRKRLANNGDTPTVTKTALQVTAPLAHIPYDQQIQQKNDEAVKQLRSYAQIIKTVNRQLRETVEVRQAANDGLPCRWHGFKASPHISEYRNKNEFTIGKNAEGEKVVGFRLSSYADGSVQVGSIDNLPHVPERAKQAAKVYEGFIGASKYDVFNPEFYTGRFRQLTVRLSAMTQELMIIVGVHTTGFPSDELVALKGDIVTYFTDGAGKELNVASIYFEEMNKREVGQLRSVMSHLYGAAYITDSILGMKFRIGPVSFFQINTQSADVLYQEAINLGQPTVNTSVLDICCGIGSIGLCFAKHCKEVLGVEIVAEAIEDATFNATENGVTNAKFYAGNCDDFIHKFVFEASGNDILAIVDPPRAGLNSKSVTALRNARGLNRFVYISCAPKAAEKNWIDLARPCSKTLKGDPFVVTQAVGVDMFPHTDHKEMVLLFERFVKKETPKEAPQEAPKEAPKEAPQEAPQEPQGPKLEADIIRVPVAADANVVADNSGQLDVA